MKISEKRKTLLLECYQEGLENSAEFEAELSFDYEDLKKNLRKVEEEGKTYFTIDEVRFDGQIDIDDEGGEYVSYIEAVAYKNGTARISNSESITEVIDSEDSEDSEILRNLLDEGFSVSDIARSLGFLVKVGVCSADDENYYYFRLFKEEIIRRGKEANMCSGSYERASVGASDNITLAKQ
jgi:hypothetical protein